MDENYKVFLVECSELSTAIEEFYAVADADHLFFKESIIKSKRSFHTLKGILNLVGHKILGHLVHRYEDCLDADVHNEKQKAEVLSIGFLLIDHVGELLENEGDIDEGQLSEATLIRIDDYMMKYKIRNEADSEVSQSMEDVFLNHDKNSEEPLDTIKNTYQGKEFKTSKEGDGHIVEERVRQGQMTRISIEQVDQLTKLTSELGINCIRLFSVFETFSSLQSILIGLSNNDSNTVAAPEELQTLLSNVSDLKEFLSDEFKKTDIIKTDLQECVKRISLVTARGMMNQYYRKVKDVSREAGKVIKFKTLGMDVALDKHIIDELKPCLIHLINNAIVHGIESSEIRKKRGKSEIGNVTFSVEQKGVNFLFKCEDDGGGIDVNGLIESSKAKGVDVQHPLVENEQILDLIFSDGVSNCSKVNRLAGRGVGMSAIKESVEKLRGRVSLEYNDGEYTKFIIEIPQSISSMSCLQVIVAAQCFYIPNSYVYKTYKIISSDIQIGEDEVFAVFGPDLIQLVFLDDILRIEMERSKNNIYMVVVLYDGARKVGVVVDKIMDISEIVVKPVCHCLMRIPLFVGVTVRGDGVPVLILNQEEIFKEIKASNANINEFFNQLGSTFVRKNILLLEDSRSTRILEQSILEKKGYNVHSFERYESAINSLKVTSFDLFIVDLILDGCNAGVKFIEYVKSKNQLKDIPVVIVSGEAKNIDLGEEVLSMVATVIHKDSFTQDIFLETVSTLLEGHH